MKLMNKYYISSMNFMNDNNAIFSHNDGYGLIKLFHKIIIHIIYNILMIKYVLFIL